MFRGVVAFAVLVAALFVSVVPAQACSCAMPDLERDAVDHQGVIFTGREIGRADVPPGADPTGGFQSVRVAFRVDRVYQGVVPEVFNVATGSGGGDCGVSSLADQPRVGVLAYGDPASGYSISICGSIVDADALDAFLADQGNPGEAPTPPPSDDPGDGEVASTERSDDDSGGVDAVLVAGGVGLAALLAVGALVLIRRRPGSSPAG